MLKTICLKIRATKCFLNFAYISLGNNVGPWAGFSLQFLTNGPDEARLAQFTPQVLQSEFVGFPSPSQGKYPSWESREYAVSELNIGREGHKPEKANGHCTRNGPNAGSYGEKVGHGKTPGLPPRSKNSHRP